MVIFKNRKKWKIGACCNLGCLHAENVIFIYQIFSDKSFPKIHLFFPISKNKTWKIFVSKILELNFGQNPFEKSSFFKIRFLIDPKTGDKGANFEIALTWKMSHLNWLKIDSKWSFLL